MNWFCLPKSICKDIDSVNRNFFWQDNCAITQSSNPIHMISWNKICHPKCVEGLGILKTEDLNMSYLAKEGWKTPTQPRQCMGQIS